MNQILNMAFRMILRKLIGHGLNKGFEHLSNRGRASDAAPDMSPQASKQVAENRKRAKDALRMARRMGR